MSMRPPIKYLTSLPLNDGNRTTQGIETRGRERPKSVDEIPQRIFLRLLSGALGRSGILPRFNHLPRPTHESNGVK